MTVLLKIELDNKNIKKEKDASLRQEYLGGLGINTRLAFDLIPAGAEPLGPENVLIFGAGSLNGMLLPTASRSEITAKSPLSGLFGTANSGGEWGPRLRYAGYDHLIFTDKSPEPVYVVINNDSVSIEDASEIWGKDVWEATDWLKNKHGKDFHVAAIGPAGENLVRYASIQNDYFASWGRTGMGAVMGSKNLKAVIVRGTGSVPIANKKDFARLSSEAFRRVKEESSFGFIRRYGSMVASDPFNKLGALPGCNFTVGSFVDWDTTRSRKAWENFYKERDVACFSCPIACTHWSKVKEKGPYQGYETRGLEITFAMEFGAKLNLSNIPEIFKCVEVCNRQGMDVISAAGSVAFLIEAFLENVVTEKEIGFPLNWGDFPSISQLLEMTAARQGIGDLLAEGVQRAAEKIPGSERFAMHVNKVEMPVKDPRAKMDVFSLGYLTNTRGGDHMRARSPMESLRKGLSDHQTEELEVDAEYIHNFDMPENLKKKIFGEPPRGVNIPLMTIYAENLIAIINSVGFCIRLPVLRSLGPDFYARALKAVYDHNFEEKTIYAAAEKIWNLQHRFNQREGQTPASYCFPARFYEKQLPAREKTHAPLKREEVMENIRDYMSSRGWE